ncbi:MAG: hypothetical protein K2J06_08395, partial [Muribaculaceae bacterium]|nr:hypothetical protein [Muribaculaceae bacterium]
PRRMGRKASAAEDYICRRMTSRERAFSYHARKATDTDDQWIAELGRKGVEVCPHLVERGIRIQADSTNLVKLSLLAHGGDCQFSHDCPERRPGCQRQPIPRGNIYAERNPKFEAKPHTRCCDINTSDFYYG